MSARKWGQFTHLPRARAEGLEGRRMLSAAPSADIAFDLDPRDASAFGSSTNTIVAAGSRAFFIPDQNSDLQTFGRELWVTEGTPATTRMVVDLTPGRTGTKFNGMLRIGDNVMFGVIDGGVWFSDGTAAGTVRITDPAVFGVNEIGTVVARRNGLAYVQATDAATAQRIFLETDGTVAGTRRIGLTDGSVRHTSSTGVILNDRLYYPAFFSIAQGTELAFVDLTTGQGGLFKDIEPAANQSSLPGDFGLVAGGSRFVFFATTTANGRELWTSDGTAAGTVMLRDGAPGSASTEHAAEGVVDGTYLYVSGRDLWRSDGTLAGTQFVEQIFPTAPGFPQMHEGTDRGFIYGFPTLVVTDATAAGTAALPQTLTTAAFGDGRAYFMAADGANGPQLWTSDGTVGGTLTVSQFPANATGTPSFSLAAADDSDGGRAYFPVGIDPAIGTELWTATPAAASAQFVANVNQSGIGSNPTAIEVLGEKVFYQRTVSGQPGLFAVDRATGVHTNLGAFQAFASGPGARLGDQKLVFSGRLTGTSARTKAYVSDGTLAGTMSLGELNPVTGNSSPADFVSLGGQVFFTANIDASARRLFRTDGTPAGTQRVSDVTATQLTVFNGQLYFANTADQSIWRVGAAGVAEQVVAPGGLPILRLGASQGRLVILRRSGFTGTLLQTHDGAPSSAPVDVVTLSNTGHPAGPIVDLGTTTVFSASGMWRTDFTAAGTVSLGLPAIEFGPAPRHAVLDGTLVYFAGFTTSPGIYRTDGTAAGSAPVKLGIDSADELTAFGGRVYFQAEAADGQFELWSSDGTTDGTAAAPTTSPASAPLRSPFNLRATDEALYMIADDFGEYGREIWQVEAPPPPVAVTDVFLAGTAWTSAFRNSLPTRGEGDAAFGHRFGPAPQTQTIGYSNLNQISLRFDGAATVESGDLVVSGVNVTSYGIAAFTYDPATFTATWTLDRAIPNDKVTFALDLDGAAGADYTSSIRVLPGDIDGNGAVNIFDFNVLKPNLNQTNRGVAGGDVNGDDVVNIFDFNDFKTYLGKTTPA